MRSKLYEDQAVVKEECAGHIQKRLGMSIYDLKQRLTEQKLADGMQIGSNSHLIDSQKNSLQNF